jgi:hypothetical protein
VREERERDETKGESVPVVAERAEPDILHRSFSVLPLSPITREE